MVSLSVVSHKAGTIHHKHRVQPLHSHIVQQHIIAALQEGRVHSKHRDRPLLCHAACHGYPMPLGNAYVKKALGVRFGKGVQPRSALHSSRNGTKAVFLFSQLTQGTSEHGRKVLPTLFERLSGRYVKGGNPVITVRGLFGIGVALALHGTHMYQNRALLLLGVSQHTGQSLYVVSVHRPEVGKAHILKDAAGQQTLLDALFHSVGELIELFTQPCQRHQPAIIPFEGKVLGFEALTG